MRFDTPPIARLPTELLYEILKYLNTSTKSLENVSLTCRRFRSLAQPLIFRILTLDCMDVDENDLAQQNIRFDLYSSDAIAPFVREFDMSISRVVEPESTHFVAKMFDALPRFINIQSLSFFGDGLDFSPSTLYRVSTLSSLERLIVKWCIAPKPDWLPVLRLRTFICSLPSHMDELNRCHNWFALLDPNHLQVLRIPLTEGSCSFFLANGNSTAGPFPSLHTLDLDVYPNTLSMLPMLLSKAPALHSLRLILAHWEHPRYIPVIRGLVSPMACPLPNIREYRGQHKLLPFIFGRSSSTPRRLFLESFGRAGVTLNDFINSFQSCHPLQLSAVTHIHISFLDSMEFKSLANFANMFPVLQEFYLHASEREEPPAWMRVVHNVDLTDLDALSLPKTLVSLSIQWTSDWNTGAPDLIAAKDRLVPRLPSLRRLWLYDFSESALLWSRTGSPSEECCTLHKVGSQGDVWEMREVAFPEYSFLRL